MAEKEYIEREPAIQAIRNIRKMYSKAKNFDAVSAVDNILGEIADEVPAADVAPVVHGHWVQKREMVRTIGAKNYTCSECGKEAKYGNYCPNCGAKMDEEVNDDKARP